MNIDVEDNEEGGQLSEDILDTDNTSSNVVSLPLSNG